MANKTNKKLKRNEENDNNATYKRYGHIVFENDGKNEIIQAKH